MRRLRHSILSIEDIDEILSDKWATAVQERCQMLCQYPEAGKQRSDLSPGLWGYPVGPYVILYRIKPGNVLFIARVPHGKRDLVALFKK